MPSHALVPRLIPLFPCTGSKELGQGAAAKARRGWARCESENEEVVERRKVTGGPGGGKARSHKHILVHIISPYAGSEKKKEKKRNRTFRGSGMYVCKRSRTCGFWSMVGGTKVTRVREAGAGCSGESVLSIRLHTRIHPPPTVRGCVYQGALVGAKGKVGEHTPHTTHRFFLISSLSDLQAHLEKSTESTRASVAWIWLVVAPTSVSFVVAEPESTDDRWEGCSLVLVVKNVATLVRLRLVKLSRTVLDGLVPSPSCCWVC